MLSTPLVTPPHTDPAEQVRRFMAGDEAALEALATRATRLALRTALALVRDRDDAADVAQDVAVDVLRSLDRLASLRRSRRLGPPHRGTARASRGAAQTGTVAPARSRSG